MRAEITEAVVDQGGFRFLARRPQAPLSRLIERIWYARGKVPYAREEILPTSQATLLINLCAPHRTTIQGESRLLETSWLVGPQQQTIVNEPLGETHMVGVTFHPSGASRFLGIPGDALTGCAVDLDPLWTSAARVGDGLGPAQRSQKNDRRRRRRRTSLAITVSSGLTTWQTVPF